VTTASSSVELPTHLRRQLGYLAPRRVSLDSRIRLRPFSSTWFLTHPEDVQHVLVTGAEKYVKTPFLTSPAGRRRAGGGLLTSTGEEHLRQRRLLQPLFHRRAVEKFESVIDDRAERWIRSIPPGSVIDLAAEMADLTQRVILSVLFGDDLASDAEDRLARAIRERRRYTEYVYHGRLPWRDRLPTRILRANRRAVETIDREVFAVLARRRAKSGAEGSVADGDLLDGLLAANYADGSRMTDAQIRDEVLTFTSTGYETLGEALTWTWYRLALHPDAEARLMEEIGTAAEDGISPGAAEHAERVLSEVMRLHPPTWIFARIPIEDDDLPRGGAVEAGATLLFCQYVLHRHPAFFPDPERFDPERFDPERFDPERSSDGRPFRRIYLPFGDGAHKCLGEHLARLEGVRILLRVTPRRRFRLLAPDRVESYGGITLRPRGGLPARVEAR
jgi:cytochrome P450